MMNAQELALIFHAFTKPFFEVSKSNQVSVSRLTPSASRKLWDLLSQAELEHQLKGTPLHEICRRLAHRQLGQTRRVLLQVANMGPRADEFMSRFLAELNEKERA